MEPCRDEQLIDRVVEGEATTADWAELEILCERDASLWPRIGRALRAESELAQALRSVLDGADAVELPAACAAAARSAHTVRYRSLAGWAAAFVLLASWVAVELTRAAVPAAPMAAPASGEAVMTADQALAKYMEAGQREGRILRELPSLIMDRRSLPDQQAFEVLYLRRYLERATVDEFLDIGVNELGAPATIPVKFSQIANGGGSL